MMNKNLQPLMNLIFLLIYLILQNAYSQTMPSPKNATLTGQVYSVFDSSNILPGANVMLIKNDTLYTAGVADKKGKYIEKNLMMRKKIRERSIGPKDTVPGWTLY